MLALAWGLVRSVGRLPDAGTCMGLVRSVGRLPGAGTCMGGGAVCREITRCWHLHGGWCGL